MSESKYRFYFPIQVRFADTDFQGHVFFGNYLTYFDEALGAYLREAGFPFQKFHPIGLDVYYVDTGCQFKGRAFFEEILHVHTTMGRIGNSSFTLKFAIHKKETDELVATGHITSVCVDPNTHRPVRVPNEFREAIAAFEQR